MHETYGVDQTSDGRYNTASAKESVWGLEKSEGFFFGLRDSQYAESEDAACPNPLHRAHVEFSDKRHGKAEDADIKHNVRHARANIHDWVIRRRRAEDPIAPEWPNLEKGSEQKRDQPGACEKYHNIDHNWESASGKESSVEAKDRELYKSYRENVPKLQHEQNLFSNFQYLQLNSE